MLLSRKSSLLSNISQIRRALVALVDQVPGIEREVNDRFGIALLLAYRDHLARIAPAEFPQLEAFWSETSKEEMGALNEFVADRSKDWPGVYRSEMLDGLWAAHRRTPGEMYPLPIMNRLALAGRDKEFAYQVAWRMTELRADEALRLTSKTAAGRSTQTELAFIEMAESEPFALQAQSSGKKSRPLYLWPEGVADIRLGIALEEGRSLQQVVQFEMVLFSERDGFKLKSSGELTHLPVWLSRLFPGYGPAHGVVASPAQRLLNIYAGLALFSVLAPRFLIALRLESGLIH